MKKLFGPALLFVLCTGATCWKPIARTVLDVAELACILESDSSDERAIAVACNVAEDLIPEVRRLLQAKKAAAQSKAAKAAASSGK